MLRWLKLSITGKRQKRLERQKAENDNTAPLILGPTGNHKTLVGRLTSKQASRAESYILGPPSQIRLFIYE